MRNRLLQTSIQKLFSVILLTCVSAGAFSFPARADFFDFGRFAAANGFDLTGDQKKPPYVEVQIPNCPDQNGVLRGKARMTTAESATELEITGYVTEAAELSHFDMKGATIETLSGGGRSRRIEVSVEENKIGTGDAAQIESDRIGRTMFSALTEPDAQLAEILSGASRRAIRAIFEQAAAKFRAARLEWRGGACVEVKLTAPKTKLMPGEKIVVTAQSVQKQEKAAINALLTVESANAGASPQNQRGIPQARFSLTAPPQGNNASIIIESVSKRGIGTGKLEFWQDAAVGKNPPGKPVGSKPPIIDPKTKPARCAFGGWKGSISVATSGKREAPKRATGARGGALQEAIEYRETNYKVDYQIHGERDTSGKFVNGFFAETNVSYLTKNYRSFVYAPAYCGTTRIQKEQQEFINQDEARGEGRVTIFISAHEKNSSFQLFAPKAVGESIYRQIFTSGCPRNDGPNTFARPGRLFEWQFKGLLVEFINESTEPGVLSGSKTIQNGDGTETRVTWHLQGECQ